MLRHALVFGESEQPRAGARPGSAQRSPAIVSRSRCASIASATARLKILAARRGRSCQEMLLRALDAYLEACATDCPCLRRDGD